MAEKQSPSTDEPTVFAVTGKPMEDYEPFVELVQQVLANGLALAGDREFLLRLDQSVPLEEAVLKDARESIRWRYAHTIDRIREIEAARAAG